MAPLSPKLTLLISRPRAAAASRASAKVSTPAATRAPYSPRECPITMSGSRPNSPSSRHIAVSIESTAGWVIAVCLRSSSACLTASGSVRSTKM